MNMIVTYAVKETCEAGDFSSYLTQRHSQYRNPIKSNCNLSKKQNLRQRCERQCYVGVYRYLILGREQEPALEEKQHVSTEVTDKGLRVMAKVHLKERPHEYIKIFLLLSKTRAEKIQLSCQKNKVCNFCSVFTQIRSCFNRENGAVL